MPYTGWTWHFITLICLKDCVVCLKRPKINEKEAGVGTFFKKKVAKELYFRQKNPTHTCRIISDAPTSSSCFCVIRDCAFDAIMCDGDVTVECVTFVAFITRSSRLIRSHLSSSSSLRRLDISSAWIWISSVCSFKRYLMKKIYVFDRGQKTVCRRPE